MDRSRVLAYDLQKHEFDAESMRLVVGTLRGADHAWVEIRHQDAWHILETTSRPRSPALLSRSSHKEYKVVAELPLP